MTARRTVAEGGTDAAIRRASLDHLSLEQALLDFEVANARVMDLTARLVESSARIAELTQELDRESRARAELEARYEAMQGSQAFRLASRIWNVRNALGI